MNFSKSDNNPEAFSNTVLLSPFTTVLDYICFEVSLMRLIASYSSSLKDDGCRGSRDPML